VPGERDALQSDSGLLLAALGPRSVLRCWPGAGWRGGIGTGGAPPLSAVRKPASRTQLGGGLHLDRAAAASP
jgi:hypothetical protein